LASAVVHAAAAATIGGVLGSTPRSAGLEEETLDVDVALVVGTPPNVPSPRAAPGTVPLTRGQTAARRRPAPRPTQGQVNEPEVSAAPATAAPGDDAPPPRFALSAGTVATGPALAEPSPATGYVGAPSLEPTAVGEGDVDVPARLLAASPLVYPPAARQAEIEIDLPVEIVVGAAGRVVSARAVSRAGYGLDEAALRAIRDYRFSPAIRVGHPVPVRMRWTVQFRLR
jgi:TonB family protein